MRLLDLFCGAGGAAMGYHRAGFDYVMGVDHREQPRYPFDFCCADAVMWLEANIASIPKMFDAVHASPPCQKYSWAAKRWKKTRADLLPRTLELLAPLPIPWVVENVVGAPMRHAIRLCGTQFGLEVLRHRMFESNVVLLQPGAPCRHTGSVRNGDYVTVAGHGGENAKGRGSRSVKQKAMGINWMNDQELNEAIPPAYTEYIGRQLIQAIEKVA